ncbi:MAG: PAS domain-containing sensor histidine kinase [Planctomycetota bacterium]|jgi:PAS domain S-box-containing protein
MSKGEQFFRTLVELAQCMIVILRRDRTIAYFNAFAQELTGHAPEEVLGSDYFELFVPPMDREEVEEHFDCALAGTSIHTIEHPLVARGAPLRWVECSFRPLKSYEDRPAVLVTAQDVTVRKHAEQNLRRRTHDLGERIKELNCLFGLSKLVEEPDNDLDDILQGLADILPPSWQYPEATCARVVFHGRRFRTYNFRQTPWRQAAEIKVHGQVVGAIEVYYLEKKPDEQEGPFLAEERRLLDALAERLGRDAERIAAQEELRIQRDFAESLIQTAPAIVLVLDPEGRIVRTNPHVEEISGYRPEEVQGKDWFHTFLPGRDRDRAYQRFHDALVRRQSRGVVDTIVTKDGKQRQVEWFAKTLMDGRGGVVGLLAIGQDITDRTALEKEIDEAGTKEQQRIGQELHDGLGQELTGIGYLAQTLFSDLDDRDAPEAETANKLADCIQHALGQVRAISRGMVPVGIDAHGLISALEQLAADTQKHCGVACRFDCPQPVPVKDTATATQLFRIVQEAVNNAVKHARARSIRIEVTPDRGQIEFCVRDDGVGIGEDLDRLTGMGLRIMQHRATMVGAILSALPAEGGGTLVVCTVPRGCLSEQNEVGNRHARQIQSADRR